MSSFTVVVSWSGGRAWRSSCWSARAAWWAEEDVELLSAWIDAGTPA